MCFLVLMLLSTWGVGDMDIQSPRPIDQKIKYLGELFPVEQMVYLEETDGSMLGSISSVVFLDEFYFVIDQGRDRVYRFGADGSFAGL